MAAIYSLSGSSDVPDLPGGLSGYAGHFIGYGLLGALALRAFARASWAQVSAASGWRAVLFSSIYGVTDEFHQSFVANRTPSFGDWIADTAGALVAVLLGIWAASLRRSPTARDV